MVMCHGLFSYWKPIHAYPKSMARGGYNSPHTWLLGARVISHIFSNWKSCQRIISSCRGNGTMKFVSNIQIFFWLVWSSSPTTLGLGNSHQQTQIVHIPLHELLRHPLRVPRCADSTYERMYHLTLYITHMRCISHTCSMLFIYHLSHDAIPAFATL